MKNGFIGMFALIVVVIAFGCGETDKIKVVETIGQYKTYLGSCVGIACSPSEQWEYCKVLVNEFTDDELVQLCEHRNPVVRMYAFEALQEKCSDRVYGVLLKHLTDTASFHQVSGCLGGETTVSEEFLSRVDFVQKEQVACRLSDAQWRELDSLRKEIVVLSDNR